MRHVRRALAAAALLGAAVIAGPAASAGAQVTEEPEPQVPAPSGYWLVGADGGIFNYGEADFHGSMGGLRLNEPVVGMAATLTGAGYWEVASDGGIFAFGDAEFHGSMGGQHLNEPMVGMAPTPTGEGYWTVAEDGGIFAFGDAEFHGSMGDTPLNAPVVGMVRSPGGGGYWLVAEDGGVFAFGDAPFAGSLGGDPPDEPIVGLAASGDGYVTVTADGRIDAFGAPEVGSLPASEVDSPIMAVANDANSEGFWLAAADGTVHALEGANHWGDASDLPLNAPVMAIASVAPDSEAPTLSGDLAEVGTTTVTFSADEPLDPASVEEGDVTTDAAAAITDVDLGGGGVTITVTFDGALALDESVTLAADSVTDLAGNAGPAEDVVITVADMTGPGVTAGDVDGATATFVADEPLDPTSVEADDVTAMSDGAVTDVALGSDEVTITVTLDAPLADGDTVTLLAGSVDDVHGNAGPEADVEVTAPDRTAPALAAGTVDGATATFVADEELDAASLALADVTETSAGAATGVALGSDGMTITVTFDAPLADGDTVTLLAGSVTDVAGNAGPAADVEVTAPDRTGPTVGAGTVGESSVTFVAGEALDPASVEDTDVETTSAAAIDTVVLEADGMTITVTLDAPLADGDTVTLLAGSVDDEAGNAGPATEVVATASVDGEAPFMTSAAATDNGDGDISPSDGGAFPTNDGWTIVFSEPVTAASAEVAEFVLTDGVTSGVFICNPDGCSLSSDGLTLTVDVLGFPVEDPDADPRVPVANIAYPATITGFSTGAAPVDLAGNPVDLTATGADNVLDIAAPEV